MPRIAAGSRWPCPSPSSWRTARSGSGTRSSPGSRASHHGLTAADGATVGAFLRALHDTPRSCTPAPACPTPVAHPRPPAELPGGHARAGAAAAAGRPPRPGCGAAGRGRRARRRVPGARRPRPDARAGRRRTAQRRHRLVRRRHRRPRSRPRLDHERHPARLLRRARDGVRRHARAAHAACSGTGSGPGGRCWAAWTSSARSTSSRGSPVCSPGCDGPWTVARRKGSKRGEAGSGRPPRPTYGLKRSNGQEPQGSQADFLAFVTKRAPSQGPRVAEGGAACCLRPEAAPAHLERLGVKGAEGRAKRALTPRRGVLPRAAESPEAATQGTPTRRRPRPAGTP